MPSRRSIADGEGQGHQGALFDTSVLIWRYLVVIRPSAPLIQDVARMKAMLAERLGEFRGVNAIAHITLLYAYLPQEYEPRLCEAIEEGITGHRAFTVHLEGPAHYPDRKSIHLAPVEKEPILRLRNSIRARSRAVPALKDLGIHQPAQPSLAIARHLTPAQFEQAWPLLQATPRSFEERIRTLVLLRGDQRAGGKHAVVRTFALAE